MSAGKPHCWSQGQQLRGITHVFTATRTGYEPKMHESSLALCAVQCSGDDAGTWSQLGHQIRPLFRLYSGHHTLVVDDTFPLNRPPPSSKSQRCRIAVCRLYSQVPPPGSVVFTHCSYIAIIVSFSGSTTPLHLQA